MTSSTRTRRLSLGALLVLLCGIWFFWKSPELSPQLSPDASAQRSADSDESIADLQDSVGSPPQPRSVIEPKASTSVAEGGAFQVVVQDSLGAPISDVQVFGFQGSRWQRIGTSDELGLVSCSAVNWLGVLARHPHYQTIEQALEPNEAAGELPVTVTLPAGGVIEGIVKEFPLNERITCAAFTFTAPGESGLGERIALQHPGVPAVVADAEGRFVITGLDPLRDYRMKAYGKSVTAEPHPRGEQPSPPIRPGSAENPAFVELTMRSVWVAHLRFTGPAGEPIQHAHNEGYRGSLDPDGHVPGLVWNAPPGFYVTGSAAVQAFRRAGTQSAYGGYPDRRNVYLITDVPPPGTIRQPIEVDFSFTVPGYAPFHGRFLLEPRSGPMPDQVFAMEQTAMGFGSMELEILGLPDAYEEPPSGPGIEQDYAYSRYALFLARGKERIALRCPRQIRRNMHFDTIPYGTYEVYLSSAGGEVRLPQGEGPQVVIGEQPARAVLDATMFGSIRFSIDETPTHPAGSPFNVTLIWGDEPKAGQFDHNLLVPPNQTVHFIVPGTYYAWLIIPWSAGFKDPNAVPVNSIFVSESHLSHAHFSR